MLMIFVQTRFHLSLTVISQFSEKYSCVKSSRYFWMFFSDEDKGLGNVCAWSAMPPTIYSFFINPGLFVRTRSR